MLTIVSSLSSGIRVNFGSMTKPLHVGRAGENGVFAAELASRGFTGGDDGMDGQWGFFQVFGGGADLDRLVPIMGKPYTIVNPGVSVKPYPCGVLSHPSIDAMLKLVVDHDLKPAQVKAVRLRAGSNILEPLRYKTAKTELEAKFCIPFLLGSILLRRKAGILEFTDEFVSSEPVQRMMERVTPRLRSGDRSARLRQDPQHRRGRSRRWPDADPARPTTNTAAAPTGRSRARSSTASSRTARSSCCVPTAWPARSPRSSRSSGSRTAVSSFASSAPSPARSVLWQRRAPCLRGCLRAFVAALDPLLHDDRAHHVRVDQTEIRERARRREGEAEAAAGLERRRPPDVRRRCAGMGIDIVVDPGHRGSHRHRRGIRHKRRRREKCGPSRHRNRDRRRPTAWRGRGGRRWGGSRRRAAAAAARRKHRTDQRERNKPRDASGRDPYGLRIN